MKIAEVKKLNAMQRFTYWIKEREAIRIKKEAGKPKPWTDDEILQSYRFCNVRRMNDKVSRWLFDNWYEPYKDHPNMLAAVCVARFINLPSSLEQITDRVFNGLGSISKAPDWKSIKIILRSLRKHGPIFNGAYMVRGNDGVDKVESVIDHNVRPLLEKTKPVIDTNSMERTWEGIRRGYGFGSFMAGQVVADLRWAMSGTWRDRNEWAPCGPGSARGLGRLLYGDEWPNAAREFVADQKAFLEMFQADVLKKVPRFLSKGLRERLEAMDYQNCLCEYDKYIRTLCEGRRPKSRYQGV